MSFTSLDYVLFLLSSVGLYHLLPVGHRSRGWLLLGASYGFYAAGDLAHLVLLLVVTGIAYAGGIVISRHPRRWLLALCIGGALGPLATYKYLPSLLPFIPEWTGSPSGLALLLPIGISFYTFQAISYLVDIYRGDAAVEWRASIVALYLAFFPQVLAGPIERPSDLIPQLTRFGSATAELVTRGAKLLLLGAFFKLAVADTMGRLVDEALADPVSSSGATIALALCAFSVQIYFDFMGYTTMALGAGLLFGIRLSENFRSPYLSISLRDFWRSWHISLSAWLRDYLYRPLGGGRAGWLRRSGIVLLVFGISGFWHGAAWSFLLWGLLHACLYLGERRLAHLVPATADLRMLHWPRRILVFLLVSLAWLPFRVTDPAALLAAARRLFAWPPQWFGVVPVTTSLSVLLLLAIGLVLVEGRLVRHLTQQPATGWLLVGQLLIFDTIALLLLVFGDIGGRDFIYYRF